MKDKLLTIYLNDHLAGARAAVELIERSMKSNRGWEMEGFLRELLRDIQHDRDTLTDVMARLGAPQRPWKQRAALVAAKLGGLKLNGRWLHYSPLSRVHELEALELGVTGKLALWRALSTLQKNEPQLAGVNFDELIARAEEQRNRVEQFRLKAAEMAFAA